MNEIILRSQGVFGQSSRALARRVDAELQIVAARSEIAQAKEIAHASTVAAALTNLDAISGLAESTAKAHPAFANEAAMLVRGYVTAAALRSNGFK
ncbi:hypothetical protein [Pseudolysinimonas sp.]|uniref:hypothetical protein n=1 Tax=Pseudolysinimonas sp. TaxID=2680009 RepID=UPI003784C04F